MISNMKEPKKSKKRWIKPRQQIVERYAWAQRAKSAGMPEWDAMNHLGHKSRAVHAAYGGGAHTAVLPLEYYEAEKAKDILKFDHQSAKGA